MQLVLWLLPLDLRVGFRSAVFPPNPRIPEEQEYVGLGSKRSGWGLSEELQDRAKVSALRSQLWDVQSPTGSDNISPLVPHTWALLEAAISHIRLTSCLVWNMLQSAVNSLPQSFECSERDSPTNPPVTRSPAERTVSTGRVTNTLHQS